MPNKAFPAYLRRLFRSPYIVSGAVHIFLLLVFALIAIKVAPQPIWHTFEWEQIFPTTPANAGEMNGLVSSGDADQANGEQQSTGSVVPNPQPSTNESDLLELPKVSSISRPVSNASLAENSGSRDYLNQFSYGNNGTDGSGNGFASSFNGGDVTIKDRIIPKVEIKDFGTVTMEFQLQSNGRVNPETIVIKAFTTSEYVNPSIDALKKWRFNIMGRFNSSKVYQINFVFNPR